MTIERHVNIEHNTFGEGQWRDTAAISIGSDILGQMTEVGARYSLYCPLSGRNQTLALRTAENSSPRMRSTTITEKFVSLRDLFVHRYGVSLKAMAHLHILETFQGTPIAPK
jgi:hypothetical protein